MSVSRQRARHLVGAYDHSLEQQILGRGSGLVCRDEQLWTQVEELLKDGDAQETHCLGLDPLRVMEEALKAATTTSTSGRRVRARGGLQGLEKAFEVLEQAALNLYLGPWREEYQVIKMHSGTFTHHIAPVLPRPQMENLFGLLGYLPGSSCPEQLRLQAPGVGPASPDDLLRLSCAFFVARCECRLLLVALGKHGGDTQWELSTVRERQRGSSLQVAVDNTRKTLEVAEPLMEQFDGEVDLYGDEQVNGGHREAVAAAVTDDESPRSLAWTSLSTVSTSAVKMPSNGVTPSPLESNTTRSSSGSRRQSRRACGESRFDRTDSQPRNLQADLDADHFCSCLTSPPVCLRRCIECDALHDITCASLDVCKMKGHRVDFADNTTEDFTDSGAVSLQSRHLRAGASSPAVTSSSAAISSLALCDDPELIGHQALQPISYHDCCDLTKLDPQVLCHSCSVFHSGSCRESDHCQEKHGARRLGVCSCGRACPRKPLVLCRYCGNEYCNNCWYRNPVTCGCGQTFDQSSSV